MLCGLFPVCLMGRNSAGSFFLSFFLVYDPEPPMPGPISVYSLSCGRTEELGRLQSITAALPFGGTAHGHPGAESQTDLVLLHSLTRKFPAPTGKCLIPFTVCALRVPGSPHAFQHPVWCMPVPPFREWHSFSQLWYVECRLNSGCRYARFDLWPSKTGSVWCSLQLPFCCRYYWVCWESPPGAIPSSCRTRAALFLVW